MTEASQLLRGTTGSVLFAGAGSKQGWAGRVDDPDLVLATTDLTGVLTHNPADLTASVRAGTSLQDLQAHLAGHDQWLALDPPSARHAATIGGLLAAGDSGPSRLRYGGLRDLVIGVTLVLADGTVARSGGHVIKNVAGYDLAKLVHGSLGSLALVAEVVVRLHPRPATTLTVAGNADAAQATAAALALTASPLEPAAVEWVGAADPDSGPGRLLVRVDGTSSPVAAAAERVGELLTGVGVRTSPVSDSEAALLWAQHADAVLGADSDTVLRVAGLPTDLAALVQAAQAAAGSAGVTLHVVSSAALGLHTVRLSGAAPDAHARALVALREAALSAGASVLLRQRPEGVDALVDALGPPPSTVPLLRRIKNEYDPTGRCAPGRFAPWY